MKQKLLFALLILFFFELYSQERRFDFQVTLGPTLSIPKTSNLTNFYESGNSEIKSLTNIGTFILPNLNYEISKKISLDFGVGFYLDRFKIKEKNGYLINDGNRNVSQIQSPINFNINFGTNGSYSFGIGGFCGLLISAKEKGVSHVSYITGGNTPTPDPIVTTNLSQNFDNDIKYKYNSVNFGTFIQLKKYISFSSNSNGFLLLKVNQYFNSIKNIDSKSSPFNYKNEKEPTTINLGIGFEI